MISLDLIREEFVSRHGCTPRLFRAPGRVNLIGEHTDYNDGFVLPVAIDRDTVVAAAYRDDRLLEVFSRTLNEAVEIRIDEPGRLTTRWPVYVEGVAQVLKSHGIPIPGATMVISSSIPIGSGLSSSAALEISTALALLAFKPQEIEPLTLALYAQEAEHKFAGVNCGIMDQLICVLGRQDHASLIDCRSLANTYVPLDSAQFTIVICDTKVKHALASSEYNQRRAECEAGVKILAEAIPGIRALRDVSTEQFTRYQDRIPEPIRRRCRHVITENSRTLAAADAFRAGEIEEAGKLLFLSHESLRSDYEVSCSELDELVESARGVEGVLGSRMTGGGFGGCTVSIVRPNAVSNFVQTVSHGYHNRFHTHPEIFSVRASDHAAEIG